MQPGDRLICAFISPATIGTKFKDWPLHVTVVPWFRLDLGTAKLAKELEVHFIISKPFKIDVQAEAQLGYKQRKTVNLVAAPELMILEGQTRQFLHAQRAWIVDEADKTRRGFRPHVTHLEAGRLHEGESFLCDQLYIVEQKGN